MNSCRRICPPGPQFTIDFVSVLRKLRGVRGNELAEEFNLNAGGVSITPAADVRG